MAVVAREIGAAAACAVLIVRHFEDYNLEFSRITRRAARHFLARDWPAAQRDAVRRIELYDARAAACMAAVAARLQQRRADTLLWGEIKRCYDGQVRSRSDCDFYRTFFNSVTRRLLGTVGVNPNVEFTEPDIGRASGTVPIRVHPLVGALKPTIEQLLCELEFADRFENLQDAVWRVTSDIGRQLGSRHRTGSECIELFAPLFYRRARAFLVGRIIGDNGIMPLVIAFAHGERGVVVDAVIVNREEMSSLFGFARSYFQVDLPAVGAAVSFLRSVMPRKPVDELYTVLGRSKQGKSERYFALRRHLEVSIDTFVHARGARGMVMIVFTLPTYDLVFKVIRDRFAPPKNTTRQDVIERYEFVFRHDRADRLVDAQEFRRLSLPCARFMPVLLDELLHEAGSVCHIDGDDLIIEHCYVEHRLHPLNLFLREADPAEAEAALLDYGQALRELAGANIFPGDLLTKNFGVTQEGRVIFYDYDELCAVTDCQFRQMPVARSEEDEFRGEPWFYVGPDDVFPEEWPTYLAIPPPLQETFARHHGELFTAGWWHRMATQSATVAVPAR